MIRKKLKCVCLFVCLHEVKSQRSRVIDQTLNIVFLQLLNSVSHISVLLGNGDGTFQNQTKYLTAGDPFSITANDFNNDKKVDLAVTNYGYEDNAISVLLGHGDGTFSNYTILICLALLRCISYQLISIVTANWI